MEVELSDETGPKARQCDTVLSMNDVVMGEATPTIHPNHISVCDSLDV